LSREICYFMYNKNYSMCEGIYIMFELTLLSVVHCTVTTIGNKIDLRKIKENLERACDSIPNN
jgi:hypothetical protein